MIMSYLLNDLPPLVAAVTLAKLLGKDVRTLRRWSRKGHLPTPLQLNGRDYFRLCDLKACPLFT
jgi:predicted site-specific integrase-resolvase